MSKITNTAAMVKDAKHPMVGLGVSGAIEAQEARGQRELIDSSQLPVDMSTEDRNILIKAGVEFGEVCPDDSLFCTAVLPKGWSKSPTDHSMWTNMLDEKGEIVAQIFYKAAYYDRRAFMHAVIK